MAIDSKLIDELLKEGTTAEELFGDNGVLKELQKRLLERILEGEMTRSSRLCKAQRLRGRQ